MSLKVKKLLGKIPTFAGKKEIRSLIFLTLILSFQLTLYSQTAAVVFQSKDNMSFQVSINHIQQYQNFSNNIRINQLKGNKPYNVKIAFENDTIFVQKNIYLIDDGLAHIYFVSKKAIVLKKIVPSASYSTINKQLVVPYLENKAFVLDTIAKDSIQQKDTAYIVPFTTYYKLEDYNGRIGCPFPIKDNELANLKGIILAENLEESKLEKVKIAIQEMDSACIMIQQIKELIVLFKYEETKLDFAKFVSAYLFDIDNIGKLADVFDFENSMDELREKVGM